MALKNSITKGAVHILCALLSVFVFSTSSIHAQIVGGNGYMIGGFIEVAVHGSGGYEGTDDWPGHHSRGGTPAVPFGFVANPQMDGWVEYDGDFFTSGTPENGFGLEIDGSNYSNNAWNEMTSGYHLNQIPTAPGGNLTYTMEGDCHILDWTGTAGGIRINVTYRLSHSNLFYTTEVTLTNTTGSDKNDVYYYRNVDPDNNESIGGSFETTNTIEAQPDPDCIKALVSATQAFPWNSYVGFGALGENFRVTHGGFSNRDASDIWNAVGLNGAEGDVNTDDESISIAYKTDVPAGESVSFTYAIVLDEGAVEQAFSSLYFVNYETEGETGGGFINACDPSSVVIPTCPGHSTTLWIDGPFGDYYDWVWTPGGEVGDTVVLSPDEDMVVAVTGTPSSDCLSGMIIKLVSFVMSEGPQVNFTVPDPICGEFPLVDLEYYHEGGGPFTDCIFLSERPDSIDQVEPEFEGPMIGPDDEVWLMCADSVSGCYGFAPIELDFIGPGAAGPDTTVILCGGPGTIVDLGGLVADTANQNGYFIHVTEGGFIDSIGVFNGSNIYGTYVFEYIIDGVDPCPSDTAVFTVTLLERPNANFEYLVDGVSSTDGLRRTCIVNTIDFVNLATMPEPGEIVDFLWTFGDGDSAFVENPSHVYESVGTYVINLIVWGDNGCVHRYSLPIEIYDNPPMDLFYTQPICFGSEDGVINVEPGIFEPYTVEILDEDGNLINDGNSAEGVGSGTYTIVLTDNAGCASTDEVVFVEPDPLIIYYRYYNPPCLGDSGYAVVDSVAGESSNNPVQYFWDPNPAGIEGFDADSSYWMKAGDYTLRVVDSRGCEAEVMMTLVDPPPFYFTEWGSDTAYCRLYDYQSGNGVVYAGAAGGIPNYTYDWTYLVDGTTGNTTTWGGRNPGLHKIEVTDAGGCVLTKIIEVDSVNPIAAFSIASLNLDENCAGTADVAVEFTNESQYFANPNNPNADTLFFWDMDRTEEDDWHISEDFYEKFDTVYKERGYSYTVDIALIAFNKNGCSDTTWKEITIWQPPSLLPPNIFSPNGSSENDEFTFKNLSKGIRDFTCIIVNRWGVQVGEINDINAGWDGNNYNGEPCTDGVYFYTYTATADNEEEFSGQGTVTLVGSRRND